MKEQQLTDEQLREMQSTVARFMQKKSWEARTKGMDEKQISEMMRKIGAKKHKKRG